MPIDGARLLLSVLGARACAGYADVDASGWRAAAEVAGWHGLRPALRHAFLPGGLPERMPDDVRRQLVDAYTLAELRAESRRRQLHELLSALAAAGVDVVVLKGTFLAAHVWPSPVLRPMSDVDLLPLPSQLPTAQVVLAELGYRPSTSPHPPGPRHAPALCRPGRLPVELHHLIEPCMPPSQLSLDAMWARATPCTIAGVPTLGLAAEDLLLHVAMHMGRSHLLGGWLPSVCDVHAWTERFGATADWDAVVARARRAGGRRFVYAALALAQQALGAAVPREVLDVLRAPADDAMVEHAMALLVSPAYMIIGASAVTNPRDSLLARVRRVAHALFVTPTRRLLRRSGLAPRGGRVTEAPRDGYLARWPAVASMVLNPGSGQLAARRVASVHALRRWAAASD